MQDHSTITTPVPYGLALRLGDEHLHAGSCRRNAPNRVYAASCRSNSAHTGTLTALSTYRRIG